MVIDLLPAPNVEFERRTCIKSSEIRQFKSWRRFINISTFASKYKRHSPTTICCVELSSWTIGNKFLTNCLFTARQHVRKWALNKQSLSSDQSTLSSTLLCREQEIPVLESSSNYFSGRCIKRDLTYLRKFSGKFIGKFGKYLQTPPFCRTEVVVSSPRSFVNCV